MQSTKRDSTRHPSMLAGMLTGVMPTIPTPASGAVRQHLMEDDPPRGRSAARTRVAPPSLKARDFTASDKALIRKVHGYMAPLQLLGILNERLQCDLGAGAALYTIDQLKGEIASVTTAVPASGNDWGALRKLLSKARRDGVLQLVNEQVINDFALVYSLDQKQVMSLKDIVLGGSEA